MSLFSCFFQLFFRAHAEAGGPAPIDLDLVLDLDLEWRDLTTEAPSARSGSGTTDESAGRRIFDTRKRQEANPARNCLKHLGFELRTCRDGPISASTPPAAAVDKVDDVDGVDTAEERALPPRPLSPRSPFRPFFPSWPAASGGRADHPEWHVRPPRGTMLDEGAHALRRPMYVRSHLGSGGTGQQGAAVLRPPS